MEEICPQRINVLPLFSLEFQQVCLRMADNLFDKDLTVFYRPLSLSLPFQRVLGDSLGRDWHSWQHSKPF